MNEVRVREKMLKRCYAHYATLELYSATTKKITWKTVQDLNATLNYDEFLMWLINFEAGAVQGAEELKTPSTHRL